MLSAESAWKGIRNSNDRIRKHQLYCLDQVGERLREGGRERHREVVVGKKERQIEKRIEKVRREGEKGGERGRGEERREI